MPQGCDIKIIGFQKIAVTMISSSTTIFIEWIFEQLVCNNFVDFQFGVKKQNLLRKDIL